MVSCRRKGGKESGTVGRRGMRILIWAAASARDVDLGDWRKLAAI